MPGTPLCAKCRQIGASEGDSWCTGCTAWDFVGRELTASWDSPGARALASDIILGAGRQIRALRSLSAGLARQAPVSGTVPEPSVPPKGRSELPRRRSLAPPPPAPKEEDLSVEEEETEEESEQREPTPEARGNRGRDPKPPEPDDPPSGHRSRRSGAGTSRVSHDHQSSSHRERSDRGSRRHSGRRRGGRKHQRLYRLADDPNKLVHRRPGQDFWELKTDLGQLELDRLGR